MPIPGGPVFELPISMPPRGSRQRVRALYGQLRSAILDGRLQAGLHMPPTRALATSLGVSRNAVIAAYELLLAEGHLVTRQGAGTFVARARVPVAARDESTAVEARRDKRLNAHWRRQTTALIDTRPRSAPRYDFRVGRPDTTYFRFDLWRRLSARTWRAFSKEPLQELNYQGRAALREAISKHVSFARAVASRPDDVMVTTGAQQAFHLIAQTLVTPGKTVVAVEDPGYNGSRGAFALAGARIAPVPVDEEGLIVERIPRKARVICVTPSHQYPLGSVMSHRRRAALLDFARTHDAVIVEDDYDGEFRFGGGPLEALQTLDRAESVFYVGTFSKCLFPEIRLGFIVVPPWAQRALITAKVFADFHSPAHAQDTLAAFISDGHLAAHVRKMRRIYDERRKLIFERLREDFSDVLEPLTFPAGLHLTAFTRSAVDEERLVEQAAQENIAFYALSRFGTGKSPRPGIVFGYGAIDTPRINEALRRLRRARSA